MKKVILIMGAILIGIAVFELVQILNISQVLVAFAMMILGIVAVILFC